MSTFALALTVLIASIGLCSVLLLIAMLVVAAKGEREAEEAVQERAMVFEEERYCGGRVRGGHPARMRHGR